MEKLTKTEEIIMLAIWRIGNDINVSTIDKQLQFDPRSKNWRTPTISTFLKRLVEKKYLKMTKKGRTITYDILISKEMYRDILLSELLFFYFDNNTEDCINTIKNISKI